MTQKPQIFFSIPIIGLRFVLAITDRTLLPETQLSIRQKNNQCRINATEKTTCHCKTLTLRFFYNQRIMFYFNVIYTLAKSRDDPIKMSLTLQSLFSITNAKYI